MSKIELSNHDIKRNLILPKLPSKELAEFVGIIIGDGYLYHKQNKYVMGIVGNPKTDLAYFTHIQHLILTLFNIATKIKVGGRGLRIVFNSKGVFYLLNKVMGIHYGRGKGKNVRIPALILKNDILDKSALRGIFDTDGTIFTSYKKGCPDYPCIELTTTSINLAKEVKMALAKNGFRVAGIRHYKYKHSDLLSYKVSLYGKNNMLLWFRKIGFSNPLKQDRLIKIIKNGNGRI